MVETIVGIVLLVVLLAFVAGGMANMVANLWGLACDIARWVGARRG